MHSVIEVPFRIRELDLSPSGQRVALVADHGAAPGEVLVLALPSGTELARFSGLFNSPKVAFRSEAELFVLNGPACWLCDLSTNTHRVLWDDAEEVRGRRKELRCCAPSPDGSAVAVGADSREGGLILLDVERPREARHQAITGTVEGITWSPDGRFLAAVSWPAELYETSRLVSVVDARTGASRRVLKFPWEQAYVYRTGFHPDGRHLAVGYKSSILLYDLDPPRSPLDPEVIFGSDPVWELTYAAPVALYRLPEHNMVSELRFAVDGVLTANRENGEEVRLDPSGRILQQTPPAASTSVYSPLGSRAGVAVGWNENRLFFWQVPDPLGEPGA